MDIFMGFVDLIPVACFLIATIVLQRDLYNKMSKGAFALFASGSMFVTFAGAYKALHKILFYTGACDFLPLKECFFPMQTTGFMLAGIGLLAMVVHPQGKNKEYCLVPLTLLPLLADEVTEKTAPEVWTGTMLFVAFMILGVAIMYGCLIYIAVKNKAPWAIVLLAVSFIFTLGMGYLSSKEGIDWVKEGVNIVGQGSFLGAAILLRRKGLANKDTKVSKVEEKAE